MKNNLIFFQKKLKNLQKGPISIVERNFNYEVVNRRSEPVGMVLEPSVIGAMAQEVYNDFICKY